MAGFGGDYRKNEKKKLSKKQMEEKAKKMAFKNPYSFVLPKLVKEK
jgi:hypothetical protein